MSHQLLRPPWLPEKGLQWVLAPLGGDPGKPTTDSRLPLGPPTDLPALQAALALKSKPWGTLL